MAASQATKVWLTPKRIERGPEAADAELKRWAHSAFRRGKLYGSVRQMRADAIASKAKGVGSTVLARQPKAHDYGASDLILAAGAVGLGFVLGWWLNKRYLHIDMRHDVKRDVAGAAGAGVAGAEYLHGVDVLSG